jgi:hypothetical protein
MAKKTASTACVECDCGRFRRNRWAIWEARRLSADLNRFDNEMQTGRPFTVFAPDPHVASKVPCKDCGHLPGSHLRNPAEPLAEYLRKRAAAEAEQRRRNMEAQARREEEWARLPRWRKALQSWSWSWTNPLIKLGPIVFFNWTLIVSAPVAVLVYKWLASWHEAGGPPTWFKAIPAGTILAASSPLVASVIRFIFDKGPNHLWLHSARRGSVLGRDHPTLVVRGEYQGSHILSSVRCDRSVPGCG